MCTLGPRHIFTLFQLIFKLWCEKDESKWKETGIGPYLKKENCSQCDQIFRNSTTLGNILKSLAINERIIWNLGKVFIAENGQILQTQSGHLVTLTRSPTDTLTNAQSSLLCRYLILSFVLLVNHLSLICHVLFLVHFLLHWKPHWQSTLPC